MIFCHLLIFFKVYFLEKFFPKYCNRVSICLDIDQADIAFSAPSVQSHQSLFEEPGGSLVEPL